MSIVRIFKSSPSPGATDRPIAPEPFHQFEISKKKNNLKDVIEDHNEVTPFNLVSLIPHDGRDKKKILGIISSRKKETSTANIPLTELPVNDLVKDVESYCLKDILKYWKPAEKGDRIKKWISIHEIVLLFGGSNSFISKFSEVEIRLEDRRRKHDHTVKKVVTMDNTFTSAYMSLEHAVHISDLHMMYMVVERKNPVLSPGHVWGSFRMEMTLLCHNECLVSALIPVLGYIDVAPTAIVKFKFNPNEANFVINDANIDSLIAMRKRGQLMNLTETTQAQDVVDFLGSEAGSDDEGALSRPLLQRYTEDTAKRAPKEKKGSKRIQGWLGKATTGLEEVNENEETGEGPSVRFSEDKDDNKVTPRGADILPLNEWTKLAFIVQEIMGRTVIIEGHETSLSQFKGLGHALSVADNMTRDTRLYYSKSADDKLHLGLLSPEDPNQVFFELSFSEVYREYRAAIFDDMME
jgi:hypothetical protein